MSHSPTSEVRVAAGFDVIEPDSYLPAQGLAPSGLGTSPSPARLPFHKRSFHDEYGVDQSVATSWPVQLPLDW